MNSKKSFNKIIIGLISLVAVIGIMAAVYVFAMPQGDHASKTIAIEVVYEDRTSDTFTVQTDEEFLRGALEQEGMIEGTEGKFGIYITSVNGVSADYDADQAWWCITKAGEMVTTGADSTTIADGDSYEITYTIG